MPDQPTTAAPASPQPENKPTQQPPPTYVGKVVRDDGVTVDRWERPIPTLPKTVPVRFEQKREVELKHRGLSHGAVGLRGENRGNGVVYDLDAAADVDLLADARADQRRASAEFSREAQASAKAAKIGGVSLWTVFTWVVVFGGVGYTAYGQLRGDVSVTTNTSERQASTRNETLSDLSGSHTNRCRELLIEWIRTGKIGSMKAADINEALRRIKEDGR